MGFSGVIVWPAAIVKGADSAVSGIEVSPMAAAVAPLSMVANIARRSIAVIGFLTNKINPASAKMEKVLAKFSFGHRNSDS
jgi:hypothetical protein